VVHENGWRPLPFFCHKFFMVTIIRTKPRDCAGSDHKIPKFDKNNNLQLIYVKLFNIIVENGEE